MQYTARTQTDFTGRGLTSALYKRANPTRRAGNTGSNHVARPELGACRDPPIVLMTAFASWPAQFNSTLSQHSRSTTRRPLTRSI